MLFEHVLYLTILKMNPGLLAWHYTESIAAQTEHFTDAFVRENIVPFYDVVTTL